MKVTLKAFQLFIVGTLFLNLVNSKSFSADSESPILEVSLFTGVVGVASLGQTQKQIESSTKLPFERATVPPDSALGKMHFLEVFIFKTIGTKVYFKRDGAGLITAQEPFKGSVKGKKIKLFSFAVPPVSDWETLLIKELGTPESRASGGRFGSEALFYNWGDISYNRMGANEIALYRNPDLSKYRLTNFGREIELFPMK